MYAHATAYLWRTEDNLWELVLSFHLVGSNSDSQAWLKGPLSAEFCYFDFSHPTPQSQVVATESSGSREAKTMCLWVL